MTAFGHNRTFSNRAKPMTTILSVNSAIDALQEVAGQDITVQGVLCFEFEDTSIDHFPKVEWREPGQMGPIRPSSIWLSVGDGALRFNEAQLKRWHGKRVTVSGTLSAPVPGFDGSGHMSTCAAEMLAHSIERL